MTICSEFSFMLQPSELGGIGVFATHDISSQSLVLSGKFSPRTMFLKDIPIEFRKYCIYLNDNECLCPERFDRMEIGWYINHSHQPNIAHPHQPNIAKPEYDVIAIRDIIAGEEILIDYNQLNEPEHLKETYYRKP